MSKRKQCLFLWWKKLLAEGTKQAEQAVETILKDGIEKAMNLYN